MYGKSLNLVSVRIKEAGVGTGTTLFHRPLCCFLTRCLLAQFGRHTSPTPHSGYIISSTSNHLPMVSSQVHIQCCHLPGEGLIIIFANIVVRENNWVSFTNYCIWLRTHTFLTFFFLPPRISSRSSYNTAHLLLESCIQSLIIIMNN